MTSSSISSSLHLSAGGYWKPVQSGAGSSGTQSSSVGSAGKTDAVSVSKLGEALTGAAADVFKQLDSKARGMLEGLVNSGKISAEDAVTGLKSMATKATFNRYVSERPRDDEDKQRLADSEAAWQKLQAYGSRMSGALSEVGRKTQEIQEAQQRGDISMDEMNERLKPVQDAFKSEIAATRGAYGKPTDQTAILSDASGFTKNMQGFKSALASMGEDAGFAELYAPDGEAAEQKLQDLGFDRTVFGNAFQTFAETVDIPGIGSKSAPPKADGVAPTPAPAAESKIATETPAVASKPDAETPSPPDTVSKPASSDPGNAQAALSMLQSALASGASKGGTGVLGAVAGNASDSQNTVASGLLEALKAGAGKPQTGNAPTGDTPPA
ncbi:hypothetical protein FBZ84_102450 [Azospirillum baldaniorum]|uniref:hypothetical protein n=1 Tax=Azospirillum baldaniorum TaxID=1064539 RepID=UPI0011AD9BB8|nr:hypothetical protein [Azospirillum baldaniorum]TWA70897.1 hypothetical protein FBZ84_102450 [Azospirillum baldaniorum]